MKQFEIHYKSHDVIEAKDRYEARRLFAEKRNMVTPLEFYDCETNESHEVIGVCEVSEQAIFEDDDFFANNEDGVMVLAKYCDEDDIKNAKNEEEE